MINKSTACGCQHSAVGCLIEDKKSKSNKHSESIAWQYQVPYRLYVFLEVLYPFRSKRRYLTILYNMKNVSVFVCIAFKNAGDRLTCQISAQYLQGKKVWKTVPSVKFTKSKACNSAKNQWGATKLLTRSVSHDDWLTCQKSAQYVQVFRKKVQKTVWSLKFTKSKVCDFAKNWWSITKVKLDL